MEGQSSEQEPDEVKKELIERELAFEDEFGTLCFAELERFSCFEAGIFRRRENSKGEIRLELICPTPVIVTARGYDIDSGEVYLRLLWQSIDGRWHQEFFRQAELYRKSTLLQRLPARGIEITEKQATGFIEYLRDYISDFRYKLESCTIVSQQGWKELPDSSRGFVLGSRLITGSATQEVTALGSEIIKGLEQKGTAEEWYEACSQLLSYPRARFMCYCSATAPLLRILNLRSFIVHNFGESSTGKSTLAELAVSLWGNPAELEFTANATKVGIERLLLTFSDLPVFLDETSLVDRKTLEEMIYLVANETGRLRGSKNGGLQNIASWKTVLLTTGEAPLSAESSYTGLACRVLELHGGLGAYAPKAIESFRDGVAENYGTLGEKIVRKILSYSESEIRESLREVREVIRRKTESLEDRLATTFAAIACGGAIFEEVLEECVGECHKNPGELVLAVFRHALEDVKHEGGYLERFLNHLKGWIDRNREKFEGEEEAPGREKLGRISERFIDIYPDVFRETAEKWGFSTRRILRELRESGISLCNHGYYYNTTYSGRRVTVLRLSREHLSY